MAWLTRVEFDVNAVRLMVGLQANNKAGLKPTSTEGAGLRAPYPRANIYANMVIALNALGRTAEADNLRASALMLYPGEPLLTVSAKKGGRDPGAQALFVRAVSICLPSRPPLRP